MTVVDVLLGVLLAGLTLYTLLAGADFGAGIWDLLAGGARRGAARRELIAHSIGPVWEANHVWLILVITLFWTTFPPAFAAFASTPYIPLTLAALGIIGRGAAFAFRKASHTSPSNASTAPPSRSPRWPPRSSSARSSAQSPPVASHPASPRVTSGAAGSIPPPSTADCSRSACARTSPRSTSSTTRAAPVPPTWGPVPPPRPGHRHSGGRRRGGRAGRRRRRRAGPFRRSSGPGARLGAALVRRGLGSLVLIATGRYRAVRVTAALAVAAVLWAWGAAQYPDLLPPDLTVTEAAGDPTVLATVLAVLAVGALLLAPSLLWLFGIFQRSGPAAGNPPPR
ncbi:cytochrome d ubiquinol oxidase subunit II [Micromonospora sp. BRA006-A]|nr:cytochrome d ubiquinol oxidase subunit II [Micromonospora sp. BRA006-A]